VFNEQIFNALVEKIEILTPAHFEEWVEGGGNGDFRKLNKIIYILVFRFFV
jgi:hypothetical protein